MPQAICLMDFLRACMEINPSCLISSKTKIDASWLMKATRKIFQGLWNCVPFTVKSIVSARCYQRMEGWFNLLKLGWNTILYKYSINVVTETHNRNRNKFTLLGVLKSQLWGLQLRKTVCIQGFSCIPTWASFCDEAVRSMAKHCDFLQVKHTHSSFYL